MRLLHIKTYTLVCTFQQLYTLLVTAAPEYIDTRRRSLRTPPRPDLGCYHVVVDVLLRLRPRCSRSYEGNDHWSFAYELVRWTLNSWKVEAASGLVKISAICPFVEMWRSMLSLDLISSRRKAMCVATCRSFLDEIPESESYTAALLSQKMGAPAALAWVSRECH